MGLRTILDGVLVAAWVVGMVVFVAVVVFPLMALERAAEFAKEWWETVEGPR